MRLLWVAGFLSACLSHPAHVQTRLDQLNAHQLAKLENARAETELGRNMAARLLGFYGSSAPKRIVRYVNVVGNYLAQFSDDPGRTYMFGVLDSEAVNAFACPGGYIFVTNGLLRFVESEAELAMILAHELVHVGKRHMLQAIEHGRLVHEGQVVDPIKLVRARPAAESSATATLLAHYLSRGNAEGLTLLNAAQAGLDLILERGLAPELEFEADRLGVAYAVDAGYHPQALIDFLARLEGRKKDLHTHVLERTHPPMGQRRVAVLHALSAMDAAAAQGAKGARRYVSYRAMLPPAKEAS